VGVDFNPKDDFGHGYSLESGAGCRMQAIALLCPFN
jgi:hypothetical protein